MKNISVKRFYSFDKKLRKWYQCISEEELIISCDGGTIIFPGQIVEIQKEQTPSGMPIVYLDDADYDLGVIDEEFNRMFAEFDIKVFEKKMSADLFQIIFRCKEYTMDNVKKDLLMGYYPDYYQVAVDRMLESTLDAEGYYLREFVTSQEIVDYMILANKYSGIYTVLDWIRDTIENHPHYIYDGSDL